MPAEGRFDGRIEFADAVRLTLRRAADECASELILCDLDFSDWPLGERALAQSLNDWAVAGRRCVLLARHFDEVQRRHARFVEWRRTWSHRVEAFAWREGEPDGFPSCILAPQWTLNCVDTRWRRGEWHADPRRILGLREWVSDCLSRARPAFAATTLGL